MNLTDAAYARLRALTEQYGLGNNYSLVVLLEQLDEIADAEKLDLAFRNFLADYSENSI